MKVGDRVKTTYSDSKDCVFGTVAEIRGQHVSIQWDGWGAPRWIQVRGLEVAKKIKKRLNKGKDPASKPA